MFDDVVIFFPAAKVFGGELFVDTFEEMIDAPVESVEVEMSVALWLVWALI